MSTQRDLGPFAVERESGAVVGPFTERELENFFDAHSFECLRILSGDDAKAALGIEDDE